MQLRESWLLFALGSALFAALTALFGKLGVAGINSNLATFIRTVVILFVTAGILSLRQEWARPSGLPLRSWVFRWAAVLGGPIGGTRRAQRRRAARPRRA